jgi:hypothetical protein
VKSLQVWLRKNFTVILALITVLMVDQWADYLWLKPLYPAEAGGLPERLYWITLGMYSFTFAVYQVININWHRK